MKNTLIYLWYLIATIMLAGMATVIFWMVYPYKTIDIRNIELVTTEVEHGQNLEYVVEYCKYTDKPATLHKTFIDSVLYRTTPVVSHIKCGCEKQTVSVEVPSGLPTDSYYLETLILYQVNPIREVEVIYNTPKFKVNGKPNMP